MYLLLKEKGRLLKLTWDKRHEWGLSHVNKDMRSLTREPFMTCSLLSYSPFTNSPWPSCTLAVLDYWKSLHHSIFTSGVLIHFLIISSLFTNCSSPSYPIEPRSEFTSSMKFPPPQLLEADSVMVFLVPFHHVHALGLHLIDHTHICFPVHLPFWLDASLL